jgi:hypothetical protein
MVECVMAKQLPNSFDYYNIFECAMDEFDIEIPNDNVFLTFISIHFSLYPQHHFISKQLVYVVYSQFH